MKVTILQENLAKGFSKVSKFVDSRNQLPILSNILISAEENKLKLCATDLENGINLWLPAKVEKQGKITIPAKTIVDFISSLPQDKVNLSLEKIKLKMSCLNYKASFNGILATEFPAVSTVKSKTKAKSVDKIRLPIEEFKKALDQVVFTAAIDETRPVLTAVKTDFTGNKLTMVATDGYRLSVKAIELKQKMKQKSLLIPARALLEVGRMYSEDSKDEEVELIFLKENNQVIFSFDNIEIVTRLIEGEYPDFEKIIPEDKETSIIVEAEEFQRAVKTTSIFAKDSANIIKLNVKNQILKVSANAPEVGENEIELEVKKNGKDNKIAFNFRFLLEYLNCLTEKEVVLEVLGPLKPGVFKLKKDKTLLHIIMPVRIQE